jgi:hypothetical protein
MQYQATAIFTTEVSSEIALSDQGQPATAAPGHARGLLADVNNVREIYR